MTIYASIHKLRTALKREFPEVTGFTIRRIDFTDLARVSPYAVRAKAWGPPGTFGRAKAFLSDAYIKNPMPSLDDIPVFASGC